MSKPYVILTGGDGGYGNLGDEWLLAAAKARYKKLTQDFRIIILKANVPRFTLDKFEYIVDNLEAFKARNVAIKDIAAVHYYGGGYLNDIWMDEKLWLHDYLIDQGLSQKRFIFTGAGLGPLNDESIARLKNIASNSRFFGTRDKSFSGKIPTTFMFDESVALVDPERNKSKTGKELWVNFRIANHVGADEHRIGQMLQQLNRFAQDNHLTVKYFSMIKGINFDERAEMKRVLLANNIINDVATRPNNYKKLIAQFNDAALVVTTSYHATLAALYSGIPAVAVYENEYYDFKFGGLKRVCDSPLLSLLNLANYTVNIWATALGANDEKIDTKISTLKELNNNAYSMIGKYLYGK